MNRSAPLLLVLTLLAGILSFDAGSALGSRPRPLLETPVPSGRIVVKFMESSGLSVEDGGVVPHSPAATSVETRIRALAPGFVLDRHFSRTAPELRGERARGERRSGRDLPDLNGYAHLDPTGPVDRETLLRIVAALEADPAVESAFLEPVAVPAALGFDARTRGFTDPGALRGDPLPPTGDFTPMQGYLSPAPQGVDAQGAWNIPGGRGQTVKVLDIEGAWLWNHEDLTLPFFTAGGAINDLGWRNHGTAVMGEMRGTVNGFGVTGIANGSQVGGVSIASLSVADAINTAAAHLADGDLFLIELHAPGPNANGFGQYGYVCMEYWQDNFDAIRVASANGRICCEAAGNGEQNLDDPIYQDLFDRDVRDSGALLCGASDGSSLFPAWFTNYGSRVDLHGWGFTVTTCGYGDLQGGAEAQWYTSGFSGTSSASPIVTGSVASLQGMCKSAFAIPLDARLARDILVTTGTPQQGTQHIGPRPNLTAAWALAQNGIGAVRGTVTDASTGLPIEDVQIHVAETGAFARTGADGHYDVPLLAGSYTLTFESFFHETTAEGATVSAGNTTVLDVPLVPRPLVEIGGVVLANDGSGHLAGVRVAPLGVPLGGTTTDSDGRWRIPSFPAGRTYDFLFDGLPGYGADFSSVMAEGPTGIALQLPPAAEDFEDGPSGYAGDPIWAWGTPSGAARGPTSGFDGARCWGVGMSGGGYQDNVSGTLTSPFYNFTGASDLRLSFHYWCESEVGFDGANVQVWNPQAGSWETVAPLEGYDSISLGGIGYENGWSGSTAGWVGTVFDLSDRISSQVRFRVRFGSDGGVTGAGFWLDEIAFDTGDETTDAPAPMTGQAPLALACGPNPTHAPLAVVLLLAQQGRVEVGIYDLAGQRLASLHEGDRPAGSVRLVWDGRDARGRALPSGAYFVRASAGGRTVAQRVTLLR